MRKLTIFALALAACSGGDRPSGSATRTALPAGARGPDALLLRVPKSGGSARVTAYPNLDSTMWTSADAAPALERVLGFDADGGTIAAIDSKGLPVWIDLNAGSIARTGRGALRGQVSVDGAAIYGVGADGAVARYTPSGNWVLKTNPPARAVFPQSNGTVLILGGRADRTRVARVHPPETSLSDSIGMANVSGGVGAPLGDRVFFVRPPSTIIGMRARTMQVGAPIDVGARVLTVAATPSGDRAYVALDSVPQLVVIDPYQNRILSRAQLPGRARDLRVDPFGRYVLVRAATGDSVWVVSIGNDRVVRTLRSQWRGDLPFVAVDGTIARLDGNDVVFSGTSETRVAGGGADFWYPFVWNGLRPRAAGLDQPTRLPGDSDSAQVQPPAAPVDSTPAPVAAPDTTRSGFTVSFAVLLDESRARDEASKITVNGQPARVVTGMTAGTTVYRVVLGPFATRDDAEKAGRATNHTYVVYAGSP